MTGHIAIAMPTGKDLVVVMTVLDRETMGIPKKMPVAKLAVNTGRSIYTNNLPQMIFRTDEIVPAPELIGQGLGGIARSPIWAVKKYKGLLG